MVQFHVHKQRECEIRVHMNSICFWIVDNIPDGPPLRSDDRLPCDFRSTKIHKPNDRPSQVCARQISALKIVPRKIAIPPLDEQILISEFLEREMEKIDSLVREQQRLIELLKEKRQAVISHAVTKGLDPKTTRAEMNKTLPLLAQKGAKHYGYMDPNQWKKFAQFFADNGEIKALPSTDDVLTNDLLPGTQQP